MSNENSLSSYEDFENKKKLSEKLQQDPLIVIIDPADDYENDNYKKYRDEQYMKYRNLSYRYMKQSDYYSLQLWGKTVFQMYNDTAENIIEFAQESKYRNLSDKLYIESLTNRNNMIDIFRYIIEAKNSSSIYESTIALKFVNEIVENDGFINYDDILVEGLLPCFTPDELTETQIDTLSNIHSYNEWRDQVTSLLNIRNSDIIKTDEKLFNLGYNPSIKLENAYEYSRNKYISYLESTECNLVDLTKLTEDKNEVVQESSKAMRRLYEKQGMYPVYIILSYTNTLFGNIIRFVKKAHYTHAGISLDSNLKTIATFKFDHTSNGFNYESIDFYREVYEDAEIDVLCIFVDKATKEKIEQVIKEKRLAKNRYNFSNLLNIIFNRAKPDDYETTKLLCSQFVNLVLKIANIDLLNKNNNLVQPQDFVKISSHPKVFKCYEGLVKEYDEKKVEKSINLLFKTRLKNNILYKDMINIYSEGVSLESLYYETDDISINSLLEAMQDIYAPELVIEKALPLAFTDKGDLSIKVFKSYEEQYQQSHRILNKYSEKNTEGIKHELYKLFAMNTSIEKRIKKMKKDDAKHKKLVDLRARILNDFNKYLKIVLKVEPKYDFFKYYKETEYYDGNVIIDNGIFSFLGRLKGLKPNTNKFIKYINDMRRYTAGNNLRNFDNQNLAMAHQQQLDQYMDFVRQVDIQNNMFNQQVDMNNNMNMMGFF